jgi:hypothetical protein
VRKSAAADLTTMATVLAAAFHDDPVISWTVPDEQRRRTNLPTLMRVFAERFQPYGQNHVNEAASTGSLSGDVQAR